MDSSELRPYIEAGKKALMGFEADRRFMERIKAERPQLYWAGMEAARREFIQAELDYVDNLDEAERRFYLSEPFGDFPRGRKFPLHTVDLLHLFNTFVQLLNLPPGARVLDLGCGSGWVAVFLAKLGYRVTGLDIAPKRIAVAKLKAVEYMVQVDFVAQDAGEMEYQAEFDAILCHGTLHHCLEEEKVLRRCHQALVDGGRILLVEPGEGHHLGAQETVARYGTIERGFSPKRLRQLLSEVGFEQITFYVSFPCIFNGRLVSALKQIAKVAMLRLNYRSRHPNIVLARKQSPARQKG